MDSTTDDDTFGSLSEQNTPNKAHCCREYTFICVVCFAYCTNVLWFLTMNPCIPDLVYGFGLTTKKSDIGSFTGLVSSSFYLGQMIAAILWPRISNFVGRRPVLLVGVFSNTVFAFVLAFVNNYFVLVALRFVSGVLTGGLPILILMLGENPFFTEQMTLFAFTSAYCGIYCLWSIICPVIGGFFGSPVGQYPHLFEENAPFVFIKSFLQRFPLFLPSIFCGVIAFVVLILTFFFAYETHPKFVHVQEKTDPNSREKEEDLESDVVDYDDLIEVIDIYDPPRVDLVDPEPAGSTGETGPNRVPDEHLEHGSEPEPEPNPETDADPDPDAEHKCCACLLKFFKGEVCSKSPIAMLVSYVAGVGLAWLIMTSIPVLCAFPIEDQGFSLSSSEIGLMDVAAGVFSLMVFLCPLIFRYSNPVWYVRLTPLIYVPFLVTMPELIYLRRMETGAGQAFFWILFLLSTLIRSVVIQLVWSGNIVLVNNSVTLASKGILMPITAFFGFLAKAAGPFVGQLLLSAGANLGKSIGFPFDIHFGFLLSVIPLLVISFCGWLVPLSLKDEKKDPKAVADDDEATNSD